MQLALGLQYAFLCMLVTRSLWLRQAPLFQIIMLCQPRETVIVLEMKEVNQTHRLGLVPRSYSGIPNETPLVQGWHSLIGTNSGVQLFVHSTAALWRVQRFLVFIAPEGVPLAPLWRHTADCGKHFKFRRSWVMLRKRRGCTQKLLRIAKQIRGHW